MISPRVGEGGEGVAKHICFHNCKTFGSIINSVQTLPSGPSTAMFETLWANYISIYISIDMYVSIHGFFISNLSMRYLGRVN